MPVSRPSAGQRARSGGIGPAPRRGSHRRGQAVRGCPRGGGRGGRPGRREARRPDPVGLRLVPLADAMETGSDPVAGSPRRGGAHRQPAGGSARPGQATSPAAGVGHVDAGAQAVADIVEGIVRRLAGHAGHAGHAASPPAARQQPSTVAEVSPGHVVADPDRLVGDALPDWSSRVEAGYARVWIPVTSPASDLPKPGLVAIISGGGAGHETHAAPD